MIKNDKYYKDDVTLKILIVSAFHPLRRSNKTKKNPIVYTCNGYLSYRITHSVKETLNYRNI